MLMYDLCCGEGGVARAAMALGWEVIGVDIVPQPNYPGKFILADALKAPVKPGADLVWCSPPCRGYTRLRHLNALKPTAKIVNPIREVAKSLARHYVIENVDCCYDLRDPIRLCGFMFGLSLIRHRLFETSFFIPEPEHRPHGKHWFQVTGKNKGSLEDWQRAMGLYDMTKYGLTQAVPFFYTVYILTYFMNTGGGTIFEGNR